MHGYATFNMSVPGPQNCCRHEMCSALPQNEHSPWKLFSRDIGEKAKQNSARNNAKCSKCFQFLCKNSDRTCFFNALTFPRSLGRCWNPRPPASVVNTSFGTWRMLMHEKPCLIPILTRQICLKGHGYTLGEATRSKLLTKKFTVKGTNILSLKTNYNRLSLSGNPRDSLKYFETSVTWHIKLAELRKKKKKKKSQMNM